MEFLGAGGGGIEEGGMSCKTKKFNKKECMIAYLEFPERFRGG